MKKNCILFASAMVLSIILSGWGYTGHRLIEEQTDKLLANKITGFESWIPFIADHCSDPDYRKSWIKDEFPKHFIDIDNYPEFKTTGSIPANIDTLIKRHGQPFVIEQGTLPWATLQAYDSLLFYLKINDWHKAKIWAANLSHYVADGHMPLHTTSNYDGDLSGNKGIHLRYESKMVTYYAHNIALNPESPEYINDISSCIFNYMYQSNNLCNPIFNADNSALSNIENNDSITYYNELWKNTQTFTSELFNRASHNLASLIYTAWVQAGSPDLRKNIKPDDNIYDCEIVSVINNTNNTIISINYLINTEGSYKIDIRNADGGTALKVGTWDRSHGSYNINVDLKNLQAGTYRAVLSCKNVASTATFTKD